MNIIHSERGQGFNIDAIFASAFLIGFVSLAIVTTGYAPSEASAGVADENRGGVEDQVKTALTLSQRDGSLQSLLLSWNENTERFVGGTPNGQLASYDGVDGYGERIKSIQNESDVEINTMIHANSNTSESNTTMVVQKAFVESKDTTTVKHDIVLEDSDRLRSLPAHHSIHSTPTNATGGDGVTLENASTYPIPPATQDGEIYNIVTVEVVIYYDS